MAEQVDAPQLINSSPTSTPPIPPYPPSLLNVSSLCQYLPSPSSIMAEMPIGNCAPSPGVFVPSSTKLTSPQSSTEEPVSSRSAMPRRCVARYSPKLRAFADPTEPQNFPEHQFPSIVGRPILRTEEQSGDIQVKDIMCGDEAAAARSMLQISYPVCPCPAEHIANS